jgi:FAD:protein FMN transferase
VTESAETFACFGGRCSVHVGGPRSAEAAAAAREALLSWHERFSRFLPASELSALNADPREDVPVSPLMARLAAAVLRAAHETGGLVDATLLPEIQAAGYLSGAPPDRDLAGLLEAAPPRRPARPRPDGRWRQIRPGRRSVGRPPGLCLDSGGLAKGLFADLLADALAGRPSHAIVCGGDLRVGGAQRAVEVDSPFDGSVLHRFELADAGVATSGIGRRSWTGAGGTPAHHLLDPASGLPAFTGVVQATAIAPTALTAEIRAKAALLSGPEGAAKWLPDGGALVLDDGSLRVVRSGAGVPARG